MATSSFFSGIKFHDNEYFPGGFFRSGIFNNKESETLSDCGFIMHQLAEGHIKACNEEQEHFLLVISGTVKPLYFIEHTFIKYLNFIKKDKKVKKMMPTEIPMMNIPNSSHFEQGGNYISNFT